MNTYNKVYNLDNPYNRDEAFKGDQIDKLSDDLEYILEWFDNEYEKTL